MKAWHKDTAWLIVLLAVGAGTAIVRHTHTERLGSEDAQVPLTIYGVRPGDPQAYVRAFLGPPQSHDATTWHYLAVTVRFTAPDGPVEAVVGAQLERRLKSYPAIPENHDPGFLTGAAWSLEALLDPMFAPRTDIQPPAPGQRYRWIIYPRFHLRVELYPTLDSAYYTLADDPILLSTIQWKTKDIPASQYLDADGFYIGPQWNTKDASRRPR